MERILYIWAIRHPASGYVQGINDLATPFLVVFLKPHVEGEVLTADLQNISKESYGTVEADTFWCFSKLLDSIQDNYTFAQPGIQRMVNRLEEVIERVDPPLQKHLAHHQLPFIQFAFRWMNCLLMRELPLRLVIRMWDTYLAEGESFVTLHVFVCAAFLKTWSEELQQLDFTELVLFIQNLPTEEWTYTEMEMLLSQAYLLRELYGHTIK
eukprot:gb/GECH01002247.1/.p1 GENE.gb/GECH01002247.1/~~gb/GECH01002247.1/.p1  ORF type:complete len:211 (+),score=41.06 gb/GECH01002247.1/:1-633(+)